jgi:Phage P22-like portal protein
MSPKPRGDDFFEKLRSNFKLAEEALVDIHREALEDFRFREGKQWDEKVQAARESDGRPCYVINRIPQFLRQVTGEQRKNRPAIQASPIGDGADIETAEIEQGLIRHIERTSNASEAYDSSFDDMATGGFGFFRLLTDYTDDEGFDQEICFQRELNPFSHYPDPRAKERDYSDAQFWFVIEDMLIDDFKEQYGESKLSGLNDFASMVDAAPGWIQRDSVRVAEYFWVETTKKTIRKGKQEREVEAKQVCWCKTNGFEILEEAEIPGEYIPIVPVLGEELRVDGKLHLIGLVRYARTPQMLYNLWQSAMAETIALAPKAPYMATPTQIEGYEDIWGKLNTTNYPYLPVNADPKAPGWPERQVVEPPIQAITGAIAHADADLHNTTGLYPESLGEPQHDQSGKAILLRQKQGSTANFGFVDSMATAIKHAGRIIIGWIPHYYDAARTIRVVNPDGTSKTVPINQPFQNDQGLQKVFDLTAGKYDVSVSSGPSYESARQEAADSILQLVQAQPALMQVVGDLLVSNFDWPMAQEIAARLKKMLPSQLQDESANALPQAQAQLAQAHMMIQQLTAAVNKLTEQKIAKLPELAMQERVALIRAKAGIFEAALKAKSTEALAIFHADIEQIDRQLSLMPDPGAQTVDQGGSGGAAQPSQVPGQPQSPAGQPPAPQPLAT